MNRSHFPSTASLKRSAYGRTGLGRMSIRIGEEGNGHLLLVGGNIGRPGAGTECVRGHSNVQGDRTMGLWERPPKPFLEALKKEFNFEPPQKWGYDTVETMHAMFDGDSL
jgi:hypothetical protein